MSTYGTNCVIPEPLTRFSVSVAFNEVVLRFVSDVGGAVVLGAVDFGWPESHVLRKQLTLAIW